MNYYLVEKEREINDCCLTVPNATQVFFFFKPRLSFDPFTVRRHSPAGGRKEKPPPPCRYRYKYSIVSYILLYSTLFLPPIFLFKSNF